MGQEGGEKGVSASPAMGGEVGTCVTFFTVPSTDNRMWAIWNSYLYVSSGKSKVFHTKEKCYMEKTKYDTEQSVICQKQSMTRRQSEDLLKVKCPTWHGSVVPSAEIVWYCGKVLWFSWKAKCMTLWESVVSHNLYAKLYVITWYTEAKC